MNKQARQAMTSARSMLIMDHPFFGCIVMQLKLVEEPFVETMAVDGTHLFYAPEFVLSLPEEELIGVIAHETYHCTYRHMTRRGTREMDRWNKACDYVINPDVKKAGFKIPSWGLDDPKYYGLSSEEVYTLLEEKDRKEQKQQQQQQSGSSQSGGGAGQQGQQQPGQKPDNSQKGQSGQSGQPQSKEWGDRGQVPDPGKMGGVMDARPSYDKEGIAAEDARWEIITRQAVNVAKSANAGVVPGFLERLVQDLEKPKVDWTAQLRRFADNSRHKDYSWTHPSRRFLHTGLILPGMISDRLEHIISVMDTSGSVTEKLIAKYAAEKSSLLDEGVCDKLTVIYADTMYQGQQDFEAGDEVVLRPKGGGGTNFRSVMKKIAEEYPDATALLFFTDLASSDFGDDPGIPVMWVCHGDPRIHKHYADKVTYGEILFVGNDG